MSKFHAPLSCAGLLCVSLTSAASVLADVKRAPIKVEVAADVPPKEAERLKLAAKAMLEDRDNKDYGGARKKLEQAIASCKKDKQCPTDTLARSELFLGVIFAESGDEAKAQQAFERALTAMPSLELGSGGLSSPAADRAFARAKEKVVPAEVKSAAVSETAPADSGLAQPVSSTEIKPLDSIAGAQWAPGLGLVQGGSPTEPALPTGEPGKPVEVPSFDQSTWFDHVMEVTRFRFALAFTFDHYDFNWVNAAKQDTLGGLGVDLRFGPSWPINDWFIPYVDFGGGIGKAGDSPNFLLFSGGNYEMWRYATDVQGGLQLDGGWIGLGGFGGMFWNHYSPSIENLTGEPDSGGSDYGPYYGGRAHLGSGLFAAAQYTWRQGKSESARIRRLEVGSRGEEPGDLEWAFFWEERERPDEQAPSSASQEARIIEAFPIKRSIGFVLRNF